MSITRHHTLGLLTLPRGMVWVDEFDWHAVAKATEYSLTGALLIDAATRQAGRAITLQAQDDAGWITRSVLQQLYALATDAGATHTLTLADGRAFSVQFASGDNPVQARPISRPELPPATHPYVATVRLIEV